MNPIVVPVGAGVVAFCVNLGRDYCGWHIPAAALVIILTSDGLMLGGLLATMRIEVVSIALVLFGLGWGGLYTLLQLLTVSPRHEH